MIHNKKYPLSEQQYLKMKKKKEKTEVKIMPKAKTAVS